MDAHKIYVVWIGHHQGDGRSYQFSDLHAVAATDARAAIKHARAWANAKYGPVSRKRNATVRGRSFQIETVLEA